jgi:hypothetical protein
MRWINYFLILSLFASVYIFFIFSIFVRYFSAGLVETDPEGALAGFAEVVHMEAEKAEWLAS